MAPEGIPAEPASPYFPEHTKATSMTALGNEILKHNFNDDVKHLENKIEDWSGIEMHRGPASAGPATVAAAPAQTSYRLRTGHLGQDKIGFRLQSEVNVKCEYSALKNELQVVVDKSLGLHSSVSFRHNTDDHKSSLNFSYAW